MISKSRKLLTLLLTVLLIMSSMSALTVSADAATSYDIIDGETVIKSDNLTKSYEFTHELETGYYMLTVESTGAATNPVNNTDGFYGVTATIGDASWTGDAKSARATNTVKPGSFLLEKDATYTVTLKYTLKNTAIINTINKLTFEKWQGEVALSTTAENKISVLNFLNRDFRKYNSDGEDDNFSWSASSDDTSWKHKAVFAANSYGIYRVTVPADTWYTVYAMGGSRSANLGKYTLYVDGTKATSTVNAGTAGLNVLKNTKLGNVKLTAGTHDLKLTVTSNTVYVGGLKLLPASLSTDLKTVNTTNTTELSFYNDRVSAYSSMNDGGATYGPPSVASGQNVTLSNSDGYVEIKSGNYATYLLNVTQAGMYDISFVGGQRSVAMDLFIDGVEPTHKSHTSTFLSGASGGAINSNVKKGKVSTVYLSQGLHEIKFAFTTINSNANWLYKWIIEPTAKVTDLSTTNMTEIIAKSTPYYNYTDSSSEISATSSTLSGVYAGNEANGYVITRATKTFYYVVNSPVAQEFTLSTITSGASGNANVTITDVDTDTVLYSGKIGTPSAGYYKTVETELGNIPLKAGRTTLKVQPRNNAQFLHAFRLTPVIENKIIADINTEIAQGEGYETVTVPIEFEGSMKLTTFDVRVNYDEDVEFVSYTAGSCYAGGMVTPPLAGQRPVTLGWLDMYVTEGGLQFSTGTFATLTFNVPKTVAKDYEFEVIVKKCQVLEDADADAVDKSESIKIVNGKVTVKSTAPIITFTNGSTAVEDVEEGTMVLNVDLNGNAKDLVIFAIYSDDGEFAVLEYSQNATIVDGIATATINNIDLDGSKNYYAKAFVWDTTTYYGFTQTLGK